MLESFVKAWDSNAETLKESIKARGEEIFDYEELLVTTLRHCFPERKYGEPDSEKVHRIDDGDYQGTLVYLVPEQTYQPSTYFVFKVSYGSCSGCDTMQAIESTDYAYGNDSPRRPTPKQVDLLWTEALHMMQGAIEI